MRPINGDESQSKTVGKLKMKKQSNSFTPDGDHRGPLENNYMAGIAQNGAMTASRHKCVNFKIIIVLRF